MNPKLILIVLVIAGLSSCTTAYKIAQTPDDVYYSPAPPQDGYVQVNNEEDRNVYNNSSPEDREILRHVNNRRWRRLHNNYDYDYDYSYGGGYYPYGSNNYPYAGTYYPYGSGYYSYGYNYPVFIVPKTGNAPSTYIGPRKYDLGTYTKPPVTGYIIDSRTGKITTAPNVTTTSNGTPVRTFAKPGVGTGVGNFLRKVLSTPNTSSTNNNNDNNAQSRNFEPSRSSNNSSSSSSSAGRSSSSSGGNAPVRTFNK